VQRVVDMLMARVQGEHAVSELRTRCAAAAECRRSGTVLSLQALAREALDAAYERRGDALLPAEAERALPWFPTPTEQHWCVGGGFKRTRVGGEEGQWRRS
jgi:hypothetical protein